MKYIEARREYCFLLSKRTHVASQAFSFSLASFALFEIRFWRLRLREILRSKTQAKRNKARSNKANFAFISLHVTESRKHSKRKKVKEKESQVVTCLNHVPSLSRPALPWLVYCTSTFSDFTERKNFLWIKKSMVWLVSSGSRSNFLLLWWEAKGNEAQGN